MGNNLIEIIIERGKPENANQLASMHKSAINQGFLSQLPPSFLNLLYRFLIKNEIVFIAHHEKEISGFISASKNPEGLFKRFLKKHLIMAGLILLPAISKKGFLKKIIESGKAGKQISEKYQDIPELLSIATKANQQSKGVGTLLLNALESDLRSTGFKQLKVVAGKSLNSANRFYNKNGFKVVDEISIHQGEESTLYLKEL